MDGCGALGGSGGSASWGEEKDKDEDEVSLAPKRVSSQEMSSRGDQIESRWESQARRQGHSLLCGLDSPGDRITFTLPPNWRAFEGIAAHIG